MRMRVRWAVISITTVLLAGCDQGVETVVGPGKYLEPSMDSGSNCGYLGSGGCTRADSLNTGLSNPLP